jgi:hypothetical protein
LFKSPIPEQSDPTRFVGTLTFQPEAGTFFRSEAIDEEVYQGSAYRLRVYGHPSYADDTLQQVDVAVTESIMD